MFLHSQMSGPTFPSPIAEMAEINRIHYDLQYTEGINQRMRIPEMLKVAPQGQEDSGVASQHLPHSVTMQVPERIVVSGDNDHQFSRPRDLDLIQSTPLEALSLKTPPRVLTLSERPLDFLEDDHRATPESEATLRRQGRSRRERSASENAAVRHSSQLTHSDSAALHVGPTSRSLRSWMNTLAGDLPIVTVSHSASKGSITQLGIWSPYHLPRNKLRSPAHLRVHFQRTQCSQINFCFARLVTFLLVVY
ncbi:mitochondrial fission factor homolog B isoform X4 [Syngnathus scovelli]|uniref:mitochondrial fission factor homolog B isoform X4 n=1 Tax=Syngnathus scovelli TaxID=161590 RepID=UPI0035CCA208